MNKITPPHITALAPNEIFVFGSNEAGRHGAGAARTANLKFGAEYYVGLGRTGQCFAIPTKSQQMRTLPLDTIQKYVGAFLYYARKRPELTFFVTEIGCGLAGLTPAQIAPMFLGAPVNVSLPQSFWDVLSHD